MKARILTLLTGLVLVYSQSPTYAAPAADSKYYTDKSQSYVQDQVSKDMEGLNKFLCMINAMAPDQMINLGPYLAMVDTNACKPNTQNNSGQTQVKYQSFEVDSTRESNYKPMYTKVWIDDFTEKDSSGVEKKSLIRLYASATQAPNKFVPYGVFRMDFCRQDLSDSTDTTCSKHIGYVDASKTGLSFYTKDIENDTTNGEYYNEFSLQLTSSSTTTNGSGIIIKSNTNNSTGTPTTSAVVFANSDNYFYRDDGTNQKCFNRSETKAQESVWRYGLYNLDGSRLKRESGFPIAYTCTSANSANCTVGETYYGYISYWGLSMPVTLEPDAIVTRKDISTGMTTNYTLKQTGGILRKYSTNYKTLADYNKLPFYFSPSNNVVYQNGTTTTVLSQYRTYEVYWDSTNQLFYAYSHQEQDPVTYNWRDVKFPSPIALDTTTFISASPWGLSAWSNSFGSFYIDSTAWSSFSGNSTRAITYSNSVVYPGDMTAINNLGGLYCFTDCLTSQGIATYNSNYTASGANNIDKYYYSNEYLARPTYSNTDLYTYTANVSYSDVGFYSSQNYQIDLTNTAGTITSANLDKNLTYGYSYNNSYDYINNISNNTSTPLPTGITTTIVYPISNFAYTLNPSTGNLADASGDVIQTTNNNVYGNGRYIEKADFDYIISTKCPNAGTCLNVPISDYDIESLANKPNSTGYSTYYWNTGADQYSHLSYLVDSNGNPVRLYPPLAISFTVPNISKYGSYRNTTVYLNYGDFGNLWGIPYKCVDLRNNADCTYWDPAYGGGTGTYDYTLSSVITPPDKQYWTAEFSIPFDTTLGIVTSGFNGSDTNDPAYVAPGTQFLVKALEKEERLLNDLLSLCTIQGLGTNITVSKLPTDADWVNPSDSAGPKPVLNPLPAPRVINGVVQY